MRFDPSSWQRAAAAFSETSGAVGGAAPVGASSGGGPTSTDGAVSAMLGKLSPSITQIFSGLASGLSSDATMMTQTAAAYGNTEQANAWAGSKAGAA